MTSSVTIFNDTLTKINLASSYDVISGVASSVSVQFRYFELTKYPLSTHPEILRILI